MLADFVKTADFKTEKHVTVIACADSVKAGEPFTVAVTVGSEIPHPNTLAHHIGWIALHFVPEGSKLSIELGRYLFSAHQTDPAAPVQVQSAPSVTVSVAVNKPGTLHATSYCNIHGLWESEKSIALA